MSNSSGGKDDKGGEVPAPGSPAHAIPVGIEVLIKKAAVDSEFRSLLLEKRSEAAASIDLKLSPAEAATLKSIPRGQLEKIIEKTTIPDEHRRIFLGKVAAAMLALVGFPLTAYGQATVPWRFRRSQQEKGGKELPPPLPHKWKDETEKRLHRSPREVYVSAGHVRNRPASGPVPMGPPAPMPYPAKVKKK